MSNFLNETLHTLFAFPTLKKNINKNLKKRVDKIINKRLGNLDEDSESHLEDEVSNPWKYDFDEIKDARYL